jgi:metal-dependent amidase/aminoacylase/carboxypeptidase family protein
MRARLLREASTLRQQLSRWRRHFHQYPELGFEEEKTARTIRAELKRLGLAPRPPVVGTDVIVDLAVPGAKRTVALRADIDARVARLHGLTAQETPRVDPALLVQRRNPSTVAPFSRAQRQDRAVVGG